MVSHDTDKPVPSNFFFLRKGEEDKILQKVVDFFHVEVNYLMWVYLHIFFFEYGKVVQPLF